MAILLAHIWHLPGGMKPRAMCAKGNYKTNSSKLILFSDLGF